MYTKECAAINLAICAPVVAYYSKLTRVKIYVEENLSEKFDLGQLAEIAGLEKKYFSTYFRKKTGVRVMEWVNAIRVNRSIQLMRTYDDSITNIAFAVGFQDLRTFERAFKKNTGVTAREFRRMIELSLPRADYKTKYLTVISR